MQDFKKLIIWQRSHQLTLDIYKATITFPKEELYGLTSQIRRACVSIPANIAEGCGREGNAELTRFLQIALGSTTELEYHLLLASDLKMIGETEYDKLNGQVNDLRKMLITFIQKLRVES